MMPQAKTVADAFEQYRKVLPSTAGPIQVKETKRAFYAGAYSLLMTVATGIEEDTPEEEGVDMLVALKTEIEEYADAQRAVNAAGVPRDPPESNYTAPDPDGIGPLMRQIGEHIGAALPHGWGYVLLLFGIGENQNLFYASSGNRGDVLRTMREFINRQTH